MMSTKEILLEEVEHSPEGMLDEVLDFVRFLKSGRFALPSRQSTAGAEAEVLFDTPRTLSDLAAEQRAFQAALPDNLVDIDLPCGD